jgi:hypothetical protein
MPRVQGQEAGVQESGIKTGIRLQASGKKIPLSPFFTGRDKRGIFYLAMAPVVITLRIEKNKIRLDLEGPL